MLGVCANAAAVTWATDQGGELLNPSGVGEWGDGNITMYVFNLSASDWTTYGYDSIAAADVSKTVWANHGSNLAGATGTVLDAGDGQLTYSVDGFSSGGTAYAAIIMAYDAGEGITHYKGNIGEWTFPASDDKMIFDMDSVVFGSEVGEVALGWSEVSDVPEPTSGLLLLLGVAGLALRRRRA